MGGICVTGMHRTGTSLVAGLLHRHGLWLGDDEDMMRPNPYNPNGYFENDRVVEIDDTILALFGGSWSAPPDFPANWTGDPRLEPTYKDARARGDALRASGKPWGFKDPRAALTLPFWLAAWGDLTVIVTLRNPLETAYSLQRRDGMTLEQGLALWVAHYRSILEHTTPATRTVVEYEAFCTDALCASTALLSQVPGLRTVDADAVRDMVRSSLRHFRSTTGDLEARRAATDAVDLYVQLQREAISGVNPRQSGARGDASPALAGLDMAVRDVHSDLQRLAAVVARLDAEIGFIRSADLSGISAQLEHQRGLVERIAQALPALGERVAATEAAIEVSLNGRHD